MRSRSFRRRGSRSSWGAAVLVTSILCGLFPAGAHAADRGVVTDLTWGISSADVAPTETAIRDLGAAWVRLEFHWHEGEPRQGGYDPQTLKNWDRAVDTAQAAGAQIVAMVHRSPQWASGSTSTYAPPRDPDTYADFMRFLAARYSGSVAAWEIWNEPNTSRFWPSGPNAAEYVSLLRAGFGGVREADPGALVVFGGLSQNDYQFVEAAYDAGAKNWFDVMSVHPYPGPHPPEHSHSWGGRISPNAFTGYREVRASMLAQGDDKPIWLTEFGWSTTTTDPWGVTPAEQADYLRRAYCVLEQDPYVEVAAWYNLRNNHWNADADEWESQLGLVKSTFERKPSYDAYKGYDPQACPATPVDPEEPVADGPPAPPLPSLVPAVGAVPTSAPPRRASPRLSVRRARVVNGHLTIDARIARAATGSVRGVATYGLSKYPFTARIRAGRIQISERLPGGDGTSDATVGLVYAAAGGFHAQWVVLHAGSRAARMRVQPEAHSSGRSGRQGFSGTVVSDARGSVALALSYRTAEGRARTVTGRSRIRGGYFRRELPLPTGARDAILYAVFPGDPARGIGGSSMTLALP